MRFDDAMKERLQQGLKAEVYYDIPLRDWTSFRIGGPAAAIATVEDRDDVIWLLNFCAEENLPWCWIGRGSNLLVVDEGFPGIIFSSGKFFEKASFLANPADLGENKKLLSAGAGISLARLSSFCLQNGASGVEFVSGIPGSLGGAVVMNASAFGGEMAQVVSRVELISRKGRFFAEGSQLNFDYRTWPWYADLANEAVVVGVGMELTADDPEAVRERCRELVALRRGTQKVSDPSAGSFFKNPPQKSAGRLIDSCGLKGLRIGDAMVAKEHANFLVNVGMASAADMIKLMKTVQEKVFAELGIQLEPEVRILGGEGEL
ncbi:UDP-N-acetylmuramate dehydrogenase [Desulforhopalus vacuolatus]|uniref:UDP-N-acetylmuramate dehydrogenase n=1 Tax=Desulforhopalus vacuolatus TaxID=40414 RepID=UPI001963C57F|nr:UDP-N-acetylmuramate dehydrogenase [Desulforhopalus vacuolatus]MBM9518537.1 UDP-N-acetylmuramate dehydrogenase [Desulforhopalus vacuolatus]